MRLALLAAAVGAALASCSDPVVEMSLSLPANAAKFDTSCTASVSVFADGKSYEQDGTDFKVSCLDLTTSAKTLDQIPAAVHDLFTVEIPEDGLSDAGLAGYPLPCAQLPDGNNGFTADMIFYADAFYTGDDLALPVIANVQCTQTTVDVQPVDMLLLAQTHKCSQATVPSDDEVLLGTLTPDPIGSDAFFSGGLEGASLPAGSNVISVPMARADVGPGICLALFGGDSVVDSLGCAAETSPVCATAPALEDPVLAIGTDMLTADTHAEAKYGPLTYGLVYQGAGETGSPMANATVTLDDPSAGMVVYFDLPAGAATGSAALTVLNQTSTNATGLFGVYTDGMHEITVKANGITQTTRIAADSEDPGAVIVRME